MTSNSVEQLIHRKNHGQYYTKQAISRLLVDCLDIEDVQTAIEFGVGPGALLDAVSSRWPSARCVSVDIDPKHRRISQDRFRRHYCADALEPDISLRIGLEPHSADVAVCNPPFITSTWRPEFERILSRTGLIPKQSTLGFGADILFLAQNLWMLRPNGQLGIIVPSGIISGERSRHVRDWLLERHCISEVVELPAGSFLGTEVRTYLLCLTKDKAIGKRIALRKVDAEGGVCAARYISAAEASLRLDYSFYASGYSDLSKNRLYEENHIQVARGNVGANKAREYGIDFCHTTDIPISAYTALRFEEVKGVVGHGYVKARKGDVLLARVGRDFFKKIALIEMGETIITDCVFAIRSNVYSPFKIHQALTSAAGQNWLEANSRGACARFITKNDLMNFPIKEILSQ